MHDVADMNISNRGSERPLYPVASLESGYEIHPLEVVRFGDAFMVLDQVGRWHVVEDVDISGVVDYED
jgi:hypothetical protein